MYIQIIFLSKHMVRGCKSRLLFAKIAMAIWFRSHGLSICKDKRLPTVLIYTPGQVLYNQRVLYYNITGNKALS